MILTFGDIHFGTTHRFSTITNNGFTIRENEHLSCLDSLKRVLKENKITKCVFGGDMYGPVGDNISGETQCAVIKFVSELAQECKKYNIPLDMIVGNHDIIHDATVFGINKLAPFKYFDNVNLYEKPTVDGNYVYLPFAYDDDYLNTFLENIPDKENKIVFSHVDIAGIEIGGGIITKKGVNLELLGKFKKVFEGHYHSFKSIGKNIIVPGSTQRLSFKDKGVSRENIVLYDEDTEEIKRDSFECPDWLTFTDDNILDILKTDNDNYVKIDLSVDMLYTDEIKAKVEQMKNSDLHIDVSRIAVKSKVEENEQTSEDEIDIIQQFVNRSENDDDKKEKLIEKGINLINRAKR